MPCRDSGCRRVIHSLKFPEDSIVAQIRQETSRGKIPGSAAGAADARSDYSTQARAQRKSTYSASSGKRTRHPVPCCDDKPAQQEIGGFFTVIFRVLEAGNK